jgi:preprotein translocase subunit SecE
MSSEATTLDTDERPEASEHEEAALPVGQQSYNLGLTRWVQFAFLFTGVGIGWLLGKVLNYVWGLFATPRPVVVMAASVTVAAVTTVLIYRHPVLHRLAHEVAGELSKVIWPSRQERWVATVVVIVTSIVAALIVGALDAVLKMATDWVFGQ